MTGKRGADSELNRDNWDREGSDEEVGTFKRASDEVLATRQIKVARRRSGVVTTGGNQGPSIFQNFSGFGGSAASPVAANSFTSPPATSPFKSSAFSFSNKSADKAESPVKIVGTVEVSKPSFLDSKSSSVPNSSAMKNGSEPTEENVKYLTRLKSLNEGVLKHIKGHLEKNLYINLMPAFNDYKTYFDQLEAKYKPKFTSSSKLSPVKTDKNEISVNVKPSSEPEAKKPSSLFGGIVASSAITSKPSESIDPPKSMFSSVSSSTPGLSSTISKSNTSTLPEKVTPAAASFSFGSKNAESKPSGFSFGNTKLPEPVKPASTGFSFGNKDSSSTVSSGFSFGNKNTSSTVSSGFSFGNKEVGSSTGFSFGNKTEEKATPSAQFSFGSSTSAPTAGFSFGAALNKQAAESSKPDEAEEDAPPKAEVVEFKEEGSVYDKRCKLFYKKDGSFIDKGVGTLFLKPVPDSKKTQLLVRASTSVGNILLNIILNSGMPVQKTGKNNVLIVCVPNPPVDAADANSPVPMLLRVKTSEDAEELLETIKKYKDVDTT